MAGLRLENISKVYDNGTVAVRDLSLTIREKEFIVLVGPSGCGKSTTLRMIAGLEQPTSGNIVIDDERVNDVPPSKRDIAMVFQNYALYPHMTVFENMAFGLKLRNMPKEQIRARVHEAATLLGMEEYLDRKPGALSGGQRQRAALGRAIVRHPKVFLFDEPLSNLDAKMRLQMRTEIARLHHRLGTTMVYVTHDQTEAMSLADRIVLMKDGVVQQIGTPLELYDKPANMFTAGFIGSPAMNFVRGTVATKGRLTFFQPETGPDTVVPKSIVPRIASSRGKGVVVGFRPEHALVIKDAVKPGSLPLSGRIDVVEHMGNEVFLHIVLDTTGLRIVVREGPNPGAKAGSAIVCSVDLKRACLFDAETQRAL